MQLGLWHLGLGPLLSEFLNLHWRGNLLQVQSKKNTTVKIQTKTKVHLFIDDMQNFAGLAQLVDNLT